MKTLLHVGQKTDSQEKYLLDANDLKTHAVVVGMTGSGKTGLSLSFLEELTRKNIPIIAIDPKGDLSNLGLIFPNMETKDFKPWVDSDQSQKVAEQWARGTAAAGLSLSDVRKLKNKLALRIFTPGSTTGESVNLLDVFSVPSPEIDEEGVNEILQSTVSGLLALCGLESNPLQDPEHIVLSKIIEMSWSSKIKLSFEDLILQLVDPLFDKVGIFPTDTFYPPKKRMELAMKLNSIIASGSFKFWKQGHALNIKSMLEVKDSKIPVNIFSLSHLQESERQFFVTLLLSKIHAFTRQLAGSQNLKALLFFDEVAGYLPPAPLNPASKKPLLTMMKQSRAVGFGVMLATQNPIDLDYRALSNAGLWCIGRLSTKQDRDRLLKGLSRTDLDSKVQGLKKREFLFCLAKDNLTNIVSSRHVMCYLKGPMTKSDIKKLYQFELCQYLNLSDKELLHSNNVLTLETEKVQESDPKLELGENLSLSQSASIGKSIFLKYEDVFKAEVNGFFNELKIKSSDQYQNAYYPVFFARIKLCFDESRYSFSKDEELTYLSFNANTLNSEDNHTSRFELFETKVFHFENEAIGKAVFYSVPDSYDEEKEHKNLVKLVKSKLYSEEKRECFIHRKTKTYQYADETIDEFKGRVRKNIEVLINFEKAKISKLYAHKFKKMEEKIEKKRGQIVDLEGVSREKSLTEVINIGETLFSFFGGRKKSLKSVVSRRSQASRAEDRLSRAKDELIKLEDDAISLDEELESKVEAFDWQMLEELDEIEKIEVGLEKNDIEICSSGLLWVPINERF